jgi:hypothetical protein
MALVDKRRTAAAIGSVTLIAAVLTWVAPSASAVGDPVLVGAGDIASCASSGDEATASLLGAYPDATVVTLGDNVYRHGTSDEYAACYDPTWGQYKARTRPAPGNHDYKTPGAAGYFAYFGSAAGDPARGYYSYDLGSWHVVVLNSNCDDVGGCQAGSAQEQWLRADLAAHGNACTLAYWHHPRFNSGRHGNEGFMQDIWQALYDAHADVVLSAHAHDYEAFGPQNASGTADPAGIREFVVGTGGAEHSPWGSLKPNSLVRNNDTFGVLVMTLHATSYDWRFVPVAGQSFTDAGSASCV